MKFQIILYSTNKKRATMADDEFEKLVKKSLKMDGFRLVGARSLDGIQSRTWEPAGRAGKQKLRGNDLWTEDLGGPISYRDPLE